MGISVDLAEYVAEASDAEQKPPSNILQRTTKIPMLMAMAPEAFDAILTKFKNQYSSIMSANGNNGSGPVTQISTLSTEAAKKMLLAAAAQAPK